MSTEIAAPQSPRTALGHAVGSRTARIGHRWTALPARWRMLLVAAIGGVAAGVVGVTTAANPAASPADGAVAFRVLTIVLLFAAGLYAQTHPTQERIGALLLFAGGYASLWLLNGSSDRVLFSVGALCSGLAPTTFSCLVLAHPTGRLDARAEQRFVGRAGGAMVVLWVLAVASSTQPPLRTPLMQCAPHCPPNVFSLSPATSATAALTAAMALSWVTLAAGTVWLLGRRARAASTPVRHSLMPVWGTAAASLVLVIAYLLSRLAGLGIASAFGAAYVAAGVVLPMAILLGLARERLFMGRALAEFVNDLTRRPGGDPQTLMARALGDPSLVIRYRRPGPGTYVDSAGRAVRNVAEDRAVTWIERDRDRVAAVVYNRDLADQERFVQAAGAAALLRLEQAQLEADLLAATAELAASRARLVEAAHVERRRLERELHDGVQEQLTALRIKLDVAAESVKSDPGHGDHVLASVGTQMDEVLQSLRALARGIYPSLLHERGLPEALRSAARSAPVDAGVRAIGVDRYHEDLEAAVYFCCLEALQNVVEHAGPTATAIVTLSQDGGRLCFEVHDSGVGFDVGGADPAGTGRAEAPHGLARMRDGIQAVGGTLAISSRPGRGATVLGSVPCRP